MNTTRLLATYGATAAVFLAIDLVWLRGIALNWYQQGIGHLMAPEPRLWAGAIFYLLYPVGLVAFAVQPGATPDSVGRAAAWGAAFGLFAYATYDLTNLTTLKGWPVWLSALDILWGAVASAVAAAAGRWAASHVG